MASLIVSFVTAHSNPGHAENPGKVHIIVPRSRAYLADLLAKAFEGREDVEIIVDKRHAERRTQRLAGSVDRRRAERRRPKDEVIEVVVGRTAEPENPRKNPS